MTPLHKEVFDEIEDRDDLTSNKVGEIIGASKQCMSKFKNKGTIGFRKLLRLSFLLFPSSQKDVMSDWCLRLDSSENIKHSFEYAAITRDIPLLHNLILKYKEEKGSLKEYVTIYEIIYGYMVNEISGVNLIEELKNVGEPKDKALRILVEIIKCYNYYFDRKVHLMLETAHEAELSLSLLGDNQLFMKECYLHRIAEILELAYLFLNDTKKARHYAFLIINANICPKTVSDASYVVGMTYLLEDEVRAIKYLQRSYDISVEVGDADIIRESRLNLDFAKIYLGVPIGDDSYTVLSDFQKAHTREAFESILEVFKDRRDDDFTIVLNAKLSGKKEKIYQGFQSFFSEENYLFASIMAKELQRLGENSFIVDQMIKFTIKTERNGKFEENFISCFNNYNVSDGGICA